MENKIPILSDYTSSVGRVIFSSEYGASYLAWMPFRGSDSVHGWITLNGTPTGFLGFSFNAPTTISSVRIKSGTYMPQMPKDFNIEALKKDGTWTILRSITNEIGWTNNEWREYTFNNKTLYTAYRINILSNQGSPYSGLNQIQFLGSSSTQMSLLEIDKPLDSLSVEDYEKAAYGIDNLYNHVKLYNLFYNKTSTSKIFETNIIGNQKPSKILTGLHDTIRFNRDRTHQNIFLSNDGLEMTATTNSWGSSMSSKGVSSGKYYWEVNLSDVKLGTTDKRQITGICNASYQLSNYLGGVTNSIGLQLSNKTFYANGGSTVATFPSAFETGVIGVALDLDNNTLKYYRNGVFLQESPYKPSLIKTTQNTLIYPAESLIVNGAKVKYNFGTDKFFIAENNPTLWGQLITEGYKPYDVENAGWLDVNNTNRYLIKSNSDIFTLKNDNWLNVTISYNSDRVSTFIADGMVGLSNITKEKLDEINITGLLYYGNNPENFSRLEFENEFKPFDFFINPILEVFSEDKKFYPEIIYDAKVKRETRFLFSKDNRNTWQKFENGSWINVSYSNAKDGMTHEDVLKLTELQWKNWFKSGTFDYLVYFYNEDIGVPQSISKICITVPENLPPVISEFKLTPDSVSKQSSVITAKIIDLEDYKFKTRYYLDNEKKLEVMSLHRNKNSDVSIDNQLINGKSFTVELNFRLTSIEQRYTPLITKGVDTTRQFGIYIDQNRILFQLVSLTGEFLNVMSNINSVRIKTETEYHLACVYDHSKKFLIIYLNGDAIGGGVSTFGENLNIFTNVPIKIGSSQWINSDLLKSLNGEIHNFRMWDRVLSYREINQYKDMIISEGSEYSNGLVGSYPMYSKNEGIKDYSSSKINGIANNVSWTDFSGNQKIDSSKWSEWSEYYTGEHLYHNIIANSQLKLGRNLVLLEAKDEMGKSSVTSTRYINVINNKPIMLSVTHDNWSLSGTIDDVDGDKVRYRILINGEQVYPKKSTGAKYTDYYDVPQPISFSWSTADLILGFENNVVTIEMEDILGATASYEITGILGVYRNLMFKVDASSNSKYYSDDRGQLIVWDNNLLSYLDFGILIAGQTSPAEPVYIKNQFGSPLKDVKIWVEQPVGYEIELSKEQSFFNPQHELNYNGIWDDGVERVFYVRVKTNPMSLGTGGTFEVQTKGDLL